jgi:hypothetical protein
MMMMMMMMMVGKTYVAVIITRTGSVSSNCKIDLHFNKNFVLFPRLVSLLRIISERTLDVDKLFAFFIEWHKTFDRVK